MNIVIKEVKTKKDLRKFIHLPASLHRNHDAWIPPIYADARTYFNPKKNKGFEYSDTVLALAFSNNNLVGRVMGLINNRYNKIHKEDHARFEFMECINDQKVAHSLITFVEEWAKEKGMKKLIGPLGFSDKDPQGFLIEGFEHNAILETACNHPHMVDLITNEGYGKKIDLNDYLIKVPEKIPELYKRIYTRVTNQSDFRIIEFKKRKELKPYIVPVFRLMNDTYEKIYGYVPMEEDEMVKYANRYLPILDPEFAKVVTINDELIGFAIAMPDLSRGLKKSKGYLFPFGIFQILHSMKITNHLVLLLGAIKSEYRGMGTDAMMAVKMLESAQRRGIKTIESHLILENNDKMNAEIIKAGGEVFKQFRIFQKDI